MKILLFTCLVTLFSTTYLEAAGPRKLDLKKELDESEMTRINAREFVVKTKDIPGSPWPEITYYALIDSTPLEAMGLFAAYDIQKDYVPNIIKSVPVKHVTATDVQTNYELRIPFPLPNAVYTHGSRIYQHDEDYELEWYMVESTSSDDVRGSAYFTPYNGKTLFKYQSYVKPKSIFGSFVKKIMFKDVEATISAIRNFIEKNSREHSVLATKYSEFITRALKGDFVYQTIINKK